VPLLMNYHRAGQFLPLPLQVSSCFSVTLMHFIIQTLRSQLSTF
jgi:hypothetical protein